ncbi:MAG: M23 family metallopeptidase [Oscillatoriophycideae cyanobacterium NC_groundwater_1537_Pr4_S-0.65um_50_18]|nr:M23 family metallopeptidase [Oscillatoriophycideae cyanobacterium NC_groundwater_1537_Pr4_S-0.65um_50_18]
MFFAIGLLLITHLVFPVAGLVWLWRGNELSKLEWLLKLSIVLLYGIQIFLIGRWDFLSYFLRFGVIALLVVAVYISFIKAKSLPFYPTRKLSNYVSVGISSLVILVLLSSLSSHIPRGYSFNGESVQLNFPLQQGTYYVAHGGNSPAINYHNVNPTQQYALDIVKLNAVGTRANGLYPRSLTNYAIWGEPLYSPCDGIIRETRNNLPDLIPPQSDPPNPAGNHILIQCQGADVLMAHLQRGSLVVQDGETVEAGQAIAKVGNSGNTTEPHLHIHARRANTGQSPLEGEGLPITFDGRFLVRNSLFVDKTNFGNSNVPS